MTSQSYQTFVQGGMDFTKTGMIAKSGYVNYLEEHKDKPDTQKKFAEGARANALLDRLLFSSVVDNFQCYLSDLVYELIQAKPESLSGKQLPAKWLFEEPDIESMKRRLIEKTIVDLGYRNIIDLAGYLKDNFGIELISNNVARIRLNLYFQIRNIVAHNRGIVNSTFLFKTESKRHAVGNIVRVPHPINTCNYLVKLAGSIDAAAVKKFNL